MSYLKNNEFEFESLGGSKCRHTQANNAHTLTRTFAETQNHISTKVFQKKRMRTIHLTGIQKTQEIKITKRCVMQYFQQQNVYQFINSRKPFGFWPFRSKNCIVKFQNYLSDLKPDQNSNKFPQLAKNQQRKQFSLREHL